MFFVFSLDSVKTELTLRTVSDCYFRMGYLETASNLGLHLVDNFMCTGFGYLETTHVFFFFFFSLVGQSLAGL